MFHVVANKSTGAELAEKIHKQENRIKQERNVFILLGTFCVENIEG